MKKPHYFYKISATSNVGRDIQTFMCRCQEAEEKAREWVEKQGASSYYESPEGMAGGVGALLIGWVAYTIMIAREIYQFFRYHLSRFEWEDVVRYGIVITIGLLVKNWIN